MKNKQKKFFVYLTILTTLLFMLSSCGAGGKMSEEGYKITNVKIYKDTPAWELAQAVQKENAGKIETIAREHPELIDFKDPVHGVTLLFWSVGTEKYKSVEALLKVGVDPDILSGPAGCTALFLAAGFSFVDNQAKKDPKYVKLLLEYGADPNINCIGVDESITPEPGSSPLMESIGCGIEKTKALIEAGADINYKTQSGRTAAIDALLIACANTVFEEKQYAYYLIVEKRAIISNPYHHISPNSDPDENYYPVDMLSRWIPKLGSEEYKIKMEIVDEFNRQGVDYWSNKNIPNSTLENIKKLYPDTWEEYIKLY